MTYKNLEIRKNFVSGMLVSFVALPLCIAISLASGFPILSGVFTAIIGGILVSQISGSHITINGPAAGMIVVILDSVENLGDGNLFLGYKYTLGAICIASIMQFLISFTRFPEMVRKFPEIVIRAMMMAIGLIVIVKQSFILFGFSTPKVGLLHLFAEIHNAFLGMQIECFLIGLFIMIFIVSWRKFVEIKSEIKFLKTLPIYLLAIIIGSILAAIFNIDNNHHFLVESLSRPVSSNFIKIPDSVISSFNLPNFDKILSYKFFIEVFSIFAVGSLETLLSASAVDKIDPSQRKTNLKKDLRAIGIGNFICGIIGALPMIAEIVRSTANFKYGATNKFSNFFHGIFLLLMITIFGSILKFIPMCALAAMLIMIGFNLFDIRLIFKIFSRSKSDFVVILCLIFFTLYIDLLAGILFSLMLYQVISKFKKPKINVKPY